MTLEVRFDCGDPEPAQRAAVLAAVRRLLEDEARRAQVPAWRRASWALRGGLMPNRWTASARLSESESPYPGMYGRGDMR